MAWLRSQRTMNSPPSESRPLAGMRERASYKSLTALGVSCCCRYGRYLGMRVALALKALLHHDDTTQRLQVMTYGEILVVTEGLVGKDGVSGLLQVWADIVYVPGRRVPPPPVVGPRFDLAASPDWLCGCDLRTGDHCTSPASRRYPPPIERTSRWTCDKGGLASRSLTLERPHLHDSTPFEGCPVAPRSGLVDANAPRCAVCRVPQRCAVAPGTS